MMNFKEQNKISDSEDLLQKFLAIEEELNLLSKRIDGIPYWELIRYPLYQTIIANNKNNYTPFNQRKNKGFYYWLRRFWYFLISLTYRNPFLAKRKALLFFGHPRKKKEGDIFIDIYIDPFLEYLPKEYSYSIIEKPFVIGKHYSSTNHKRLYIDSFLEIINIWKKIVKPKFSSEDEAFFLEIENLFYQNFNVDISLKKTIKKAISKWKVEFFIYRKLFYFLKPKAIFLVVSAGSEVLIAAARSLKIPTVELQHGSPAQGKLNYEYPSDHPKSSFPDYFLSFGKIYSSYIPLPEERIIPVGFPYLYSKVSQYQQIDKKDQILIISQPGHIGDLLADFAEALAQKLEGKLKIIYKVHPKELNEASQKYSYLAKKGIILANSRDDNLYSLLAVSRWQLGVYSTALYEGIAFSCITFILEAPGSKAMNWLVNEKGAKSVRSVTDLVNNLEFNTKNINDNESIKKKVFSPVSSKKIADFIKLIT